MQSNHRLLIKGMVCQRCISTVKNELDKAGFETKGIQLGEVTFSGAFDDRDEKILAERLRPFGFSLIEDRREKLIQQVKILLKEIYSGAYDFPVSFRFSELVAERTGVAYEKVSASFSELEKITLEKYLIAYRTEKVKEFLVYADDTLADIAFKLNFSSVAHLSRQFKQQTGLTTSYFKEIRQLKTSI